MIQAAMVCYTYSKAIEAGVDIVDTAIGALAGLTSQPSAQTLYYALEGNDRQPKLEIESLEQLSLLLGRSSKILS